ncbi:hypothetical protein B0H14DRAFT_2595960 [Mycena olivaceomarginata]|nr:hypothetical protein B0H14DRAFT_2595960 [Mycena olivaceomarginata]
MHILPFLNVPDQETRDVSRWRDISTPHRLGKYFIHLELRQTRGGNTHKILPQLFKLHSLNLSDLSDPRDHLGESVGPTGTWSITIMAPTKNSSRFILPDGNRKVREKKAFGCLVLSTKRRVQMAEKRALKKARRRVSDKPRPKKKSAQPRTTKVTSRTTKGRCSSLPGDSDSDRLAERSMLDAEREATETLAGMWWHRSSRSPGPHEVNHNSDAPDPFQHWQDTIPVEDVDSLSDDEPASGLRNISEVAGHPAPDITEPITPVQAHGLVCTSNSPPLNARFTPLSTPSASPVPSMRMPGLMAYMDVFVARRRAEKAQADADREAEKIARAQRKIARSQQRIH